MKYILLFLIIVSASVNGQSKIYGDGNFTNSSGNSIMMLKTTQKVGIGGVTSPTAILHLPAGTATANTAPLKLTTGTALTTPEDGAVEYHGSHIYFTIGSTRYQLDQQNNTLDAKFTTAGNSGTGETDLYSYTVPANTLTADGRTVNFEIDGEVNDATATAQLKLWFAGNTTLNTGAVNISTGSTAWRLKGYIMRTSSTTAHVTWELDALGLATPKFLGYSNLTSLDFTATNIFKITAQAGGAGGGTDDITAHSWQVTYKPQP